MTDTEVLRYAAFTTDPAGGNPAGVVLDAGGLDEAAMLAIAAEVGYSETAFLQASTSDGRYAVRYFSPLAEVPFCGHATIAAAVALAERGGPPYLIFSTSSGPVPVTVERRQDGRYVATLTSAPPEVTDVREDVLRDVLTALRWSPGELDPELPPRVAYAGAAHLVLAAGSRKRLAALDYDVDALRGIMLKHGWTTVHLVWRENAIRYAARDPFPVGGVYEDPATGAAAAAFGGYLRALGLVAPPASITIQQGDDLGRPSTLLVGLDAVDPRVRVSGPAVALAALTGRP